MGYERDMPAPGCLEQFIGLTICAIVAVGLILLAHHFHWLGF